MFFFYTDEWHMYDCIAIPKIKHGVFSKAYNYLTGGDGKKIFQEFIYGATNMMPAWEGLCLNEWKMPGIAEQAFIDVANVTVCMRKYLRHDVYSNGMSDVRCRPLDLYKDAWRNMI